MNHWLDQDTKNPHPPERRHGWAMAAAAYLAIAFLFTALIIATAASHPTP